MNINYLRLEILGKKNDSDLLKLSGFVEQYPFSNGLRYSFGGTGAYILANYNTNTLYSSNKYAELFGVVLSISYIEFLMFLKQHKITLKTHTDYNGKIQYEFLTYPDQVVNKKDQYILDELYIGKLSGIGKLYSNGNKYHIGNQVIQEYDVYLEKNHNKLENYVRILLDDGEFHWVKVSPILWKVDENNFLIYTNRVIIPFDKPLTNNLEDCNKYINNILYSEMNYHANMYISKSIIDKFRILCELNSYKDYLIEGETKPKIILKK